MLSLFVATTNAGKLRDFALAAKDDVSIAAMPGLGSIAAPEEDEDTFEGNARVKAVYYSRFAPGAIVIADDSGLEVDALHGLPGVRSARYVDDCGFVLKASTPVSVDERNNACLIAALRDVRADERGARYRCALVAARDGVVLAVGVGTVEGGILDEAHGSGGFGYDPFFLPEGEAESMAELSAARRMGLSHRGRAMSDLLVKLSDRGEAK